MEKINKTKGFTLIELLVVIAIIALLLSILVPALTKVKDQAKFVICKSNLRNYGLVGTMYAAENTGKLPYPWKSIYSEFQYPGENRNCRWHNEDYDLTRHPEYAGPLWPYLEVKDVNLCPAFKSISFVKGEDHPSHTAGMPIVPQFGYSMNGFLGVYGGPTDIRDHYVDKISKIAQPATVFFFAEENMWLNQWCGNVLNDNALISHWTDTNVVPYEDAFATFHKAKDEDMNEGVSNAVFCDGHVEQVDPGNTQDLSWPF